MILCLASPSLSALSLICIPVRLYLWLTLSGALRSLVGSNVTLTGWLSGLWLPVEVFFVTTSLTTSWFSMCFLVKDLQLWLKSLLWFMRLKKLSRCSGLSYRLKQIINWLWRLSLMLTWCREKLNLVGLCVGLTLLSFILWSLTFFVKPVFMRIF